MLRSTQRRWTLNNGYVLDDHHHWAYCRTSPPVTQGTILNHHLVLGDATNGSIVLPAPVSYPISNM